MLEYITAKDIVFSTTLFNIPVNNEYNERLTIRAISSLTGCTAYVRLGNEQAHSIVSTRTDIMVLTRKGEVLDYTGVEGQFVVKITITSIPCVITEDGNVYTTNEGNTLAHVPFPFPIREVVSTPVGRLLIDGNDLLYDIYKTSTPLLSTAVEKIIYDDRTVYVKGAEGWYRIVPTLEDGTMKAIPLFSIVTDIAIENKNVVAVIGGESYIW